MAFEPIEEEEVPMGRVSLGNSLRKDGDPVNRFTLPHNLQQKLWDWIQQSPSRHNGRLGERKLPGSPHKT